MKNLKKEYLELEIEVSLLLARDVLTASDENDVMDDPYSGDDKWWE